MALVPYIGDAESMLTKLIKMAGKSDEMMLETFEMVTKTDELKPLLIRVVDAVTGGKATEFISNGAKEEDIVHIAANKGNFKNTYGIARDDGLKQTRWLEEGKLGSALGSLNWVYDKGGKGWLHIRNNHVLNPSGNQFAQKFGQEFIDEEKIKNLIYRSIKQGVGERKVDDLKRVSYIYNTEIQPGKILRMVVNEAGEILTSYPV